MDHFMSQYRWLLSSNSGLYSARRGAPRFSIMETVDFLADAGFEAIDVNFSATITQGETGHEPMLDGDDWRERMAELKARADRRGLRIFHSHAPFRYNYQDTENPLYPMCDEMMHRSIEATGLLGGKHIVVHPVVKSDRSNTLVEETLRALEPLARYAEQFGVRLAVENMSGTDPETLLEIVERLDADVCWDNGHAHIRGLDQEASLVILGKRVKVLHIHDNYGSRGRSLSEAPFCDLHQPPFMGDVDWDSYLRGLDRIGFEGPFNYEVQSRDIPESLRADHARYLVRAAAELMGRLS